MAHRTSTGKDRQDQQEQAKDDPEQDDHDCRDGQEKHEQKGASQRTNVCAGINIQQRTNLETYGSLMSRSTERVRC